MLNPLRVALLTGKMSPASGGLSVSVPGLAHGLDVFDDIEMHVLGTKDVKDPDAWRGWGPRVQAFPAARPIALQRAPGMSRALAVLTPHLVDVQGLWTWSSKVSLHHHNRFGTPYLVTPRGMLDPWARRNSAWKKWIFATFAENSHLRNAACLRATSEMEASHFRAMGLKNPIAIVPNGIDLPELAERKLLPLRTILFLGRIHPKKGLAYLLNAWQALHGDFPDWQLIVAGIDENGHERELKQLAAENRLGRIHFIGEAHGETKQQLYRNADLFVLPTHAENFGLVVAEALAQETAVITTTNAPWAGLRTHDCGWWIDLQQELLNDTMRGAMLQTPQALAAMGQRGRAWIGREFGSKEVAARMRNVYLWAAGRASRPDYVHAR